ncbi:hypothetical protein C8Q80DRAFT_1272487 [Daedaleopsis nitida]|nr:hypothetical protein C8Q80DRAFT_1272487 [Daedaleopsis nitida]
MPATRAASRHGSRPPQPYASGNAGPSNAVLPLFVDDDDDGPPRKRHVVDRKPSKQRAKQKARAPLPPAAEIIEISSDEDEPLAKRPSGSMSAIERKIRELEEENKRLKAAVAAVKVLPPAPMPQPQVQAALDDKVLSTIEDHISCEVCTLKMWHPYTLSCGHTFCKDCLQDWFNTAYVQHLSANPHYDLQKIIPAQWRATLARPDIPSQTRITLEREISNILIATPQPQYSCPTCRVHIKAKPAENFVVKHLVRTIAGVQGESCPQEAPVKRIPGRPVDGPFDGFFPYSR